MSLCPNIEKQESLTGQADGLTGLDDIGVGDVRIGNFNIGQRNAMRLGNAPERVPRSDNVSGRTRSPCKKIQNWIDATDVVKLLLLYTRFSVLMD